MADLLSYCCPIIQPENRTWAACGRERSADLKGGDYATLEGFLSQKNYAPPFRASQIKSLDVARVRLLCPNWRNADQI